MGRPALMRLDALLVKRGLAQSRLRAKQLIEQGDVLIDGIPARKASTMVRTDRAITMAKHDFPWVSRGAFKLLGALEDFEPTVAGAICADLGSSTGGFTQVLLEKDAQRVYAIDVGRGQMAWPLRDDPRIVLMEGVNARYVEELPEPIDLVVGDLSFIGLELILPTVHRILKPGGIALLLVKPQFEAGKGALDSRGRVTDPQVREQAIDQVREQAKRLYFEVLGGADCHLPGAKSGNVEYFLHLRVRPKSPA